MEASSSRVEYIVWDARHVLEGQGRASSSSEPSPSPGAPSPVATGLAWGLLAAAIWASYTVLARPRFGNDFVFA